MNIHTGTNKALKSLKVTAQYSSATATGKHIHEQEH